jgi:hypothetical protein
MASTLRAPGLRLQSISSRFRLALAIIVRRVVAGVIECIACSVGGVVQIVLDVVPVIAVTANRFPGIQTADRESVQID